MELKKNAIAIIELDQLKEIIDLINIEISISKNILKYIEFFEKS